MLEYKTKNVNVTWNEISAENSTVCEMDEAITMTTQYKLAGKIMEFILIFNLVSYIIGVMISHPTWINKKIERNNKYLEEYNRIQIHKDGNIVTTAEEDEKYEKLKPKLPLIERKLKLWKVLQYFAKLLWPFMIVIPHEYLTGIFYFISILRFIPQGTVDNNLGPDRLQVPRLQIPTIADNQLFDCTTFVWKT